MDMTAGTVILSTVAWAVTTVATAWLRARPSRPRSGCRLLIGGLPAGSRIIVRGGHTIMIDTGGSRSEDGNAAR
jgi:hypothetical protein